MKFSITIPAYKPHFLLQECISRINRYTDLSDGEVIVVCNGSEKESANYVLSLGEKYRLVWYDEPLGFTHAANICLTLAQAPYIILMNTDSFLEANYNNSWINRLLQPFEDDPFVGITGITDMVMEWGHYFPFCFVGLRKSMIEKIGLFDMRFSPGYGEDADMCYRAKANGYKLVNVAPVLKRENSVAFIDYPLTHIGEKSFTDKEARAKYCENQYVVLREKWGTQKF